jgi:hypothetical protein
MEVLGSGEQKRSALIDNGTFELVQLPHGRKAIGSKWVFATQIDPLNGTKLD